MVANLVCDISVYGGVQHMCWKVRLGSWNHVLKYAYLWDTQRERGEVCFIVHRIRKYLYRQMPLFSRMIIWQTINLVAKLYLKSYFLIRSDRNRQLLSKDKMRRPHLPIRMSYHLDVVGGLWDHLLATGNLEKQMLLSLIMVKMIHWHIVMQWKFLRRKNGWRLWTLKWSPCTPIQSGIL